MLSNANRCAYGQILTVIIDLSKATVIIDLFRCAHSPRFEENRIGRKFTRGGAISCVLHRYVDTKRLGGAVSRAPHVKRQPNLPDTSYYTLQKKLKTRPALNTIVNRPTQDDL